MPTQVERKADRGQALIFVVLVLAVILMGFVGFATDYTNFWHQRQMVQSAADAVCQAGAMDLLLYAQKQQTPKMNFDPANGGFLCSAKPTAAPCVIAKLNGYDPALAGTVINIGFPSGVTGAAPPSGVAYPYIQVDLTHDVPAYFSRVVTSKSTVTVGGHATCGLVAPPGPIPIVVLHPSLNGALTVFGAAGISIIGGPQQSVHVNSSSATAASVGSVDLRLAGPTRTGGDFAVFGGPATKPGSISLGSTGHYIYPSSPIADPYRQVAAPAQPANVGTVINNVPYKQNGCPDSGKCDEYSPGYYPSGITVKGNAAIFDPGLYYVVGGMHLQSNSTVRVSTAAGDGSGGVVFYFSGNQSIDVWANSGSKSTTSDYYVDGSISPQGVPSRAMQCPGGAAPPAQVPATVNGNILLGPCTGPYADPSGQERGFVFFQDRDAAATPAWGGGGQFLLAGFMYFHQCKSLDGAGKGTNCSTAAQGAFGNSFGMQGNACSGSYVVGSLITDTISLGGNPCLNMILAPNSSFAQLKVALLK